MKSRVAQSSSGQLQTILVSSFLAAVVSIVLLLVAHGLTTTQIIAAAVTGVVIAVLDLFPIYLDPTGELRLTTVIAIPTLVLFDWPAALLGTAIGTMVGFLYRPWYATFVQGTERLGSLIVTAAITTALESSGVHSEITASVLTGASYTLVRTLLVSFRMHVQEAISWSRGLRFLASATLFHQAVFTAVAAVTVWTVNNDPSTTSRVLVPVLAAAVTLQLYLPRILRGEEQRRVLAGVSVLAAAVDAKDPYTADHSIEVAELSRRVARIMNLEEPEVHRIYLAGLLHDVGKTVVPASILLKSSKLTDEEWQVMRSHVEAGVRIVQSIEGLADVAPIVAASHEQLDGRGYPAGLKEDEVPLGSRINLVIDAYNALTTNRPYRAALSADAAFLELEKNAGTQFDPRVIDALRIALRPRPYIPTRSAPTWLWLLQQPAFALLWVGELVSFLGDQIFFIALSLWIYNLTASATLLATTLIAATVGQGLLGFFAGAIVDRADRRGVIIATDIGRALIVAALPFAILHSIPAGLALLVMLNIGTVFFRSAIFALMPSVVRHEDLPTATALFHSTERIAEVIGGVLGGAIVLTLGYHLVFYLDALSFLMSAMFVGLMPVAWRAGLASVARERITVEIGKGLQFIWRTPLHRTLALLIVPGYLTLAFDALQTPMIIKTAGLSAVAFGVINSVLGIGKLAASIVLAGSGKQWVSPGFTVITFLLTALAAALFGANKAYVALCLAAFLFGFGNIATTIANTTLSIAYTPPGLLGRLLASRQVFIAGIKVIALLLFGTIADVAGPPLALVSLGLVSGLGVAIVWFFTGRQLPKAAAAHVPSGGGG